MPTLTLTDEQVIGLIKQLPPDQQEKLFHYLTVRQWPDWADLSRQGQDGVHTAAAQRGRDWDKMTETEREMFIDYLAACRRDGSPAGM